MFNRIATERSRTSLPVGKAPPAMASRHPSPPPRPATQQLQRRLGVVDSTAIGLGSMLGAGVFVVFAPAAGLAGPLLAVAVAVPV